LAIWQIGERNSGTNLRHYGCQLLLVWEGFTSDDMIQNERVEIPQCVQKLGSAETLPNGGQVLMAHGAEDPQYLVSVLNRILAHRPDTAVSRRSNAYRDGAS
jgi:hypothetical protein